MRNYCTQNNGDCSSCSLVNYGRDCHNSSIMMGLREWAAETGHSDTSARSLIRRGKLPQAIMPGTEWLVPEGTEWPEDRRYKNGQ